MKSNSYSKRFAKFTKIVNKLRNDTLMEKFVKNVCPKKNFQPPSRSPTILGGNIN